MNFLEFIERYEICPVTARLCVDSIEHDFDAVIAMTDDEFVEYRDFIRSLTPYWLGLVYKQCPVIENEIVWSGFGGADWEELVLQVPDWAHKRNSYYRAPKFFNAS